MSSIRPIVRDTRRTDLVAAAGQTVFDFPSPLFDPEDLKVYARTGASGPFVRLLSGFTVTVTPAGRGQVLFYPAPRMDVGDPALTIRLIGARTHERRFDVTRGGVIRSQALEDELDRQTIIDQELRRDVDEVGDAADAAAASAASAAASAIAAGAAAAGVTILNITRAQIALQAIPAVLQRFSVSGFATANDAGANAIYMRGTSAGPMALQDTLGGWFELFVSNSMVRVADFGALGGADDTAAIELAYDYACSIKGQLVFGGATYTISTLQIGGPAPEWRVIRRENVPPASPVLGDKYLVGAAPTGAFGGQSDKVATWGGASWSFGAVVPNETYVGFTQTNTIDLRRGGAWVPQRAFVGHRGCTFVGNNQDMRGNSFRASTLRQKAGTLNAPMLRGLGGDAPHFAARGLIFDGNAGNQTTSNKILHLEDDVLTAYAYGAIIDDCQFIYSRGTGIHVGQGRAFTQLTDLTTFEAGYSGGQDGVYVDSYDVILTRCHIGKAGGFGIYVNRSSYCMLTQTDSYTNILGGLYISASVADLTISQACFNDNGGYGIDLKKYTGSAVYPAKRVLVSVKFLNNSASLNNGFADLNIASDDTDTKLVGCQFMGSASGIKPSHAILFGNTAASVEMAGCAIGSGFYATGGCNNWPNLIGYVPLGGGLRPQPTGTSQDLYAGGATSARFSNPANATSFLEFLGSAADIVQMLARGTAADINMVIRPKGAGALYLGGGSTNKMAINDTGVGFHGAAPNAKPAAVPVTIAAVHAALVSYGLIS